MQPGHDQQAIEHAVDEQADVARLDDAAAHRIHAALEHVAAVRNTELKTVVFHGLNGGGS